MRMAKEKVTIVNKLFPSIFLSFIFVRKNNQNVLWFMFFMICTKLPQNGQFIPIFFTQKQTKTFDSESEEKVFGSKLMLMTRIFCVQNLMTQERKNVSWSPSGQATLSSLVCHIDQSSIFCWQ